MPEGSFNLGLGSRSDSFRPSVNVQQGSEDPLLRFLIEAGAMMPDDMRAQQGRQPLSEADRDTFIKAMNDRRSVGSSGSDPFDLYRWHQPPGSQPMSPDVLHALVAGQSVSSPSFRAQSDEALFQQRIADLLSGNPDPQSREGDAIRRAAGPVDMSIISRFYGQREP